MYMNEGRILKKVQVNIPFRMLDSEFLQKFLKFGLNPEIGLDSETLDGFKPVDFKDIAHKFQGEGRSITLHAPFLDLSAGSSDSAIRKVTRERLEQTLRLVPVFEPMAVICHSGWDHRRYVDLKPLWLEQSCKMWTWFAEAVRDCGSRLMLENVYERSPEEFLEIYGPLRESGVLFCLDTGHQSAFGEASLESWVNVLGKEVGQLHLHDNHGTEDEHLAPGKGTVDFEILFRELPALVPQPPIVTLEPHCEEDLWEGVDYLNKCFPW
jgi:sugar phosphate isomerase/epimerase